MTEAGFWDELYRERERRWSGAPNGVLVVEVADLAPGRALDVGCGEGADAAWLAERGWRVTAVDISEVALARARADTNGAAITWRRLDLTETAPEPGGYDLVSAQYFPIRKASGEAALRGLLAAVAPGGTLLVVGHTITDPERHHDHFDPADFYLPEEIAATLDESWTIETNESRPRVTPPPEGTDHTHDSVLRARRAR